MSVDTLALTVANSENPECLGSPFAGLSWGEFKKLHEAIVSGTTCHPTHAQWHNGSPFRECLGCGACATRAVEIAHFGIRPARLVPLCDSCTRWEQINPKGARHVLHFHAFLPIP